MSTPKESPSLPPERHIATPAHHGLWSPATEALIQTLWAEQHIPAAAELREIPNLFNPDQDHRMDPRFLTQLRERVITGRVRCGDSAIDDFIDDALGNDLLLESFFVVKDTRAGRLVHPLDRGFMRITPFQMVTELAWALSVADGVEPVESSLMHAAGLFYGCGYFLCAHPYSVAKRQGLQATLEEIHRARMKALSAPLRNLTENFPIDGALLSGLLLGWPYAEVPRMMAGLEEDDTNLRRKHARLLTRLHLRTTKVSHIWQDLVRWTNPNA